MKNQGERNIRKTIEGIVMSDKMDKTITVKSRWHVRHKKYGKLLLKHTILHAHDEKDEAKTGDLVEITETRPTSKTKRWRLVKVVARDAVRTIEPELNPENINKAATK